MQLLLSAARHCTHMNLHVELAMPPCRPWGPAKICWTEGELQVCDCGHAHMGWFFCCSQCERALCVPCFRKCSDATIRRRLAADVPDDSAWGKDVFINTCKTCGDAGMGEGKGLDRCPLNCVGRRKWRCRVSLGCLRIEHADPGACECSTCRNPRPREIRWDDPRTVVTLVPTCRARRLRVVPSMRSLLFTDEECCKRCFRNMFWQIGTVAVTDRSLPAPFGGSCAMVCMADSVQGVQAFLDCREGRPPEALY